MFVYSESAWMLHSSPNIRFLNATVITRSRHLLILSVGQKLTNGDKKYVLYGRVCVESTGTDMLINIGGPDRDGFVKKNKIRITADRSFSYFRCVDPNLVQ